MVTEKKKTHVYLLTVGAIIILGLYFVSNNRFYLQSSGGGVYKIDRWTGKTWLVTPYGEKAVKELGESKSKTPFPIANLVVGNINGSTEASCVKISGTITST